ncbi:MAG TPA: autotransporter domain-containing protein [Alphaproteobacteria bacterium]|nr:autotransporter domain-containing protein [Alphaproteobacteria bacterium]
MGPLGRVLLAGSSLAAIAATMSAPRNALADTTISATTASQQNWAAGNFTITNTGTISNPAVGINATDADSGTLTIFSGGKINATTTGISITNTAVIGTISNSGTISTTGGLAITIAGGATISSLSNTGTLNGGNTDIANRGRIGTVTNSGVILKGFSNLPGGTIQSVNNSGTITASSGSAFLNQNATIGTLTNSGTITFSGGNGLGVNGGSIGLIGNSGLISAGNTAVSIASGTISTLTNSGTITGNQKGLLNNSGTITALTNSGTITSAANTGLKNSGTITTLTNSGMISGVTNAINYAGGSLGPISLSGVIAGSILNSSANGLTIAGGNGSTFGVLTGYNSGTPSAGSPGTVGSISSSSANLVFSSGNLLLNDNVNMGSKTLVNSGAALKFQNTLTITGQYSQSGGGLIAVATSGGSSYAAMSITGNATVSNATVTISGSGLTKGETFSVVRSGGTGSYTNDTATISGTRGLKASVSTSGNNLVVSLADDSTHYTAIAQSGGGAAASSMAPALDAINTSTSATATAFQNSVLNTLDALPSASQAAAIGQLAPTQLVPAVQVATQAVTPTTAAVEQHQLNLSSAGGVGLAAGSNGHESAVWGQVLGGGAMRDTTASADGFHSRSFGLVGGFDRQATPDLLVGVAVSWLTSRSTGLDASSGSAVTTDTYQLTGYGVQRWGQLFVDGQAGIGYTQFRQNRAISFLGATADAHYDGVLYLAKAGVGYDVPAGGVTLTPLAGVRYLREVIGSYTETGAGSADLAVSSQGVTAVTQDLGGEVSWSVETGLGKLTPEVRLAWVHDYKNGPIAASGLIGGASFTNTVARPAADGARLNLAATLDASDEVTLRAEFEGEVRHDYQSATGLLKASLTF